METGFGWGGSVDEVTRVVLEELRKQAVHAQVRPEAQYEQPWWDRIDTPLDAKPTASPATPTGTQPRSGASSARTASTCRTGGDPRDRSTRQPATGADIQGLRAVAVVVVICFHVLGWPTGGYLGVEAFFVVSGFVITGVLLRAQEHTGRISLRAFWARRARRILPRLFIVIGAVLAVLPWADGRPRSPPCGPGRALRRVLHRQLALRGERRQLL